MKKKRKKGLRIVAFFTVLAFSICSFILFLRDDVQFALYDTVARFQSKEIDKVSIKEDVSTKTVTIEELKSYSNITFDESMLLVNEEYRINEDYKPYSVEYEARAVTVNACIVQAFTKLSKALLEETGETLYISSALRSFARQKQIKEEKGAVAQSPGSSEHQTGLAVDVYVQYYGGESFIKSEAGQFINSNCDDYGFIIRYPFFGKSQTGISYEPWHLRYVGFPHAKIINNSLITYEQYVDFFEPGIFYEYNDYLISRQTEDKIIIPENFNSAVVSKDNTGHIFLTFDISDR